MPRKAAAKRPDLGDGEVEIVQDDEEYEPKKRENKRKQAAKKDTYRADPAGDKEPAKKRGKAPK